VRVSYNVNCPAQPCEAAATYTEWVDDDDTTTTPALIEARAKWVAVVNGWVPVAAMPGDLKIEPNWIHELWCPDCGRKAAGPIGSWRGKP
jgi:hypothetical protein